MGGAPLKAHSCPRRGAALVGATGRRPQHGAPAIGTVRARCVHSACTARVPFVYSRLCTGFALG
eukprot:scaffold26362_cov36-Phaeocystis_antarctica.AAC.1